MGYVANQSVTRTEHSGLVDTFGGEGLAQVPRRDRAHSDCERAGAFGIEVLLVAAMLLACGPARFLAGFELGGEAKRKDRPDVTRQLQPGSVGR